MESVLVCVTLQKNCEKLIRAGKRFADSEKLELYVISVVRPDDSAFLSDEEQEALNYLYQYSRDAGAEMLLLQDDDILGTVQKYAFRKKAICVVVGCGHDGHWTFANRLRDMLSEETLLMKA